MVAESLPIDDLEPLAEMIGAARIVAIGENNHHIAEFGALRDRILRFLVEHHGFRVLGFESGFAEGGLVDKWINGGDGQLDVIGRDGFTFSLGESAEVHAMLNWLRERENVRYAGLDVPSSAGSPVPALNEVRTYLERVDPDALDLVDGAVVATEAYSAVSSGVAPARYAKVDKETRDAATSALAQLLAQFDLLAPVYRERSSRAEHAIARHQALGALRVDSYLREVENMMSGKGSSVQGSSRDEYMAATVRLLRELHGEDTKIVLMVHNGHLQRLPMRIGEAAFPSAGTHLADEYGDDYFALALTAITGSTTGLRPDEDARLGFTVYEQQLGEPQPGSIEHALAGREAGLLDLRSCKDIGAQSIRHAHMFTEVDVAKAFDAVIHLPESHVSAHVK